MTKKSIQHGFISGRAYAKALQEQRSAITMDAADVAQYAALKSVGIGFSDAFFNAGVS